jgi:hypothetical protein
MKRIFTLAVLTAAAFSTCWAQVVTPTVGERYQILNASGGCALTNSNNSCIMNTPDVTDPNQMWVFETASDAGYYYMKNASNNSYLYQTWSATYWWDKWDMGFSTSLPSNLPAGEYQLSSLSSGNVGIYLKSNSAYLGADGNTAGTPIYGDKQPSNNGEWQLNLLTVDQLTAARTTVINNIRAYETSDLSSYTGLANELESAITQYNTTCTTLDEVLTSITNLKTAWNNMKQFVTSDIAAYNLWKTKCTTLISRTDYPGKSAFQTTYDANSNPSAMSSTEIQTACDNLNAAIKTYMKSQVGTPDAPADYTCYIQHPWFCNDLNTPLSSSDADIAAAGLSANVLNSDGWTNVSSLSTGYSDQPVMQEEKTYYSNNRTVYNFWEKFSQGSLAIKQDLTGLPIGFYTVSCDLWSSAIDIAGQHVYSSNTWQEHGDGPAITVSDSWQTSDNAVNGRYYVPDGNLTIGSWCQFGINTSVYDVGSYCTTNFQLKYYGNILDLNEAKDYTPVAITSCGAQLKRTFTAGNWSTLCVPFSVANADIATVFGTNAQVANFTGVTLDDNNNITLNFSTTNAAITANTPCLIKLAQTADKYDVPATAFTATAPADVTFESTANSSNQKVTAVMKGTYSKIATLPTDGTAYIINGNKFYQVNSDVSLKPFRAYFTLATAAASVKALNVSVDGEATAVTGINADETPAAGNIYNLSGQQIRHNATNAASLPKGVYIKNGKKFVVK